LSKRIGIVGAGIVGLAHAWLAAEQGHRVTVFERSPKASGASIRNFGMIWPIGQANRELYGIALRSRARWLAAADEAGFSCVPCGSIHLAHRSDEWMVLEEFSDKSPDFGVQCSLLTSKEVLARTPAVNANHLLGGLYSPTELCINPPNAIRQIPIWLNAKFEVQFEFSTAVTRVEPGRAVTADDRKWDFDRIVICSGADLELLFPKELAQSGIRTCKLQMLSTRPQRRGWRIGPHLASGLTLRHYRIFEVCESLAALRSRIAEETPELDRYGIHVMASQNDEGAVILGDSHEYGEEIEPFDQSLIEELILRELRKVIRLPDWTIARRWHGIYGKHPELKIFAHEPLPGVHLRTGIGGTGMTMAFGLAEADWENWR
jgi:FAD dependent oxidoreductase TIGR03364